MTTQKNNKENLERIFDQLRELVTDNTKKRYFMNTLFEYVYSLLHNDRSLALFLELYRSKEISEKTFIEVYKWCIYEHDQRHEVEKLRYKIDMWEQWNTDDIYFAIEKLHYKVIEHLDQPEQMRKYNASNSPYYHYNPEQGKGYLMIPNKAEIAFSGRVARILEVIWKHRGSREWLGSDHKDLGNVSTVQLRRAVESANKRIDKCIEPLIEIKPKMHDREMNMYRWR